MTITGTVLGAGDALSDGLGIDIDDGTGIARAVIGIDAIGGLAVGSGRRRHRHGPTRPARQRRDGRCGLSHPRHTGGRPRGRDPDATPTPTPTPAPTPTPTPTPSPQHADPLAEARYRRRRSPRHPARRRPRRPTSTPGTTELTPAEARTLPVGTWVTVRATVTAEAGRLGTHRLFAIGDDAGGIAVRLPLGQTGPTRGTSVVVVGQLAEPYGQLEIRPKADGIRLGGIGAVPRPYSLGQSGPDESSEGRLVAFVGRLAREAVPIGRRRPHGPIRAE